MDPNGSFFLWKIMINHQQSHVHKSKHAVFINQLTYHKINWLNHHAWWNPKICWWNPMSCWWRPAIHKWLQITGHPVPSSTSTRRLRRLRRLSPQGHGARWHLRGLAVNSMDISGTNLLNPLKILMGFVQKNMEFARVYGSRKENHGDILGYFSHTIWYLSVSGNRAYPKN